ncbi:amidohydrolase family protein [Muricauda sp. JGD-17]|uniref:Amidohydrolase family protein n=1 Tax=Flagellimonas ochracea TaxID=2696472 RepID=A0A964TA63_9FLAO|nr:amidohydrolase family protein [Allomuricauda ochracea]NAY90441.1 amidohydrolase family protein [Allomuricauda ochracea]
MKAIGKLGLIAFVFWTSTTNILAQNTVQHIFGGHFLDVHEDRMEKNVLISVQNGRIIALTRNPDLSKYDDFIDLSEYTLLPGLIDCHTHLTDPSFDKTKDVYELPIASYGILGAKYAKQTLQAGFTTVRDVGADFYVDIALRDAINKNWIEGPRMYVSGKAITMTGGHGVWANWMAPQFRLEPNPGNPVDGALEVRKRARTLIKNGVNLLKINATGGFGTSNSIPGAASFTIEEMKAAVEEANKRGIKVAAHSHGADGIKNAVKAGVNSIEHGTFLDHEAVDLIKEHNVFLVMDLLAAYVSLMEMNEDISDKGITKNNQELYEDFAEKFGFAYKQGVKMAFGSDASIYEHGRNAEQFKLMRDAGMKPIDILKSVTINAAELIGIEKNTGSIDVGKWADIIGVKGNPLDDIQVLENVDFVMKEGIIYKSK